jgi:hypothetical protein
LPVRLAEVRCLAVSVDVRKGRIDNIRQCKSDDAGIPVSVEPVKTALVFTDFGSAVDSMVVFTFIDTMIFIMPLWPSRVSFIARCPVGSTF